MNRLARYIENEFTRNSWFYAQAESGMMAAMDFIEYVLRDENLIQLTPEEKIYIDKVRGCYLNLQNLTKQMKEEIEKYKEAYQDLLTES